MSQVRNSTTRVKQKTNGKRSRRRRERQRMNHTAEADSIVLQSEFPLIEIVSFGSCNRKVMNEYKYERERFVLRYAFGMTAARGSHSQSPRLLSGRKRGKSGFDERSHIIKHQVLLPFHESNGGRMINRHEKSFACLLSSSFLSSQHQHHFRFALFPLSLFAFSRFSLFVALLGTRFLFSTFSL